ncbi:MAG TPA: histidine kinase dimerization/phosphoacceptor domain -containing protein [Spirochaetia bacterium]|nr:histidine kinase dimerization/phosphoacceptor domain -containing protein [Spirochaetales bacterium]HRY73576.1 histidine kinase dimerization/phosphoacceptor domain -containing protein [Spirochaetia bacterium]
MPAIRVLLVEDDEAHAELMARAFAKDQGAWELERASTLAGARRSLAGPGFGLVIADFRLPDGEGLELLASADGEPALPVLVLTSHGSEAVAADSIKRGALDYVVKSPESFAAMPGQARKALRAWALLEEKREAESRLRRSLAEKEVLLKEVHHRVKNNFQIVSSLLSLQAEAVGDGAARDALLESEQRIRSMALIHEKLYESDDYARIDFPDYLRSVAARLEAAYRAPERGIGIGFETEPVDLSLETAIPLGLVLNELVTNALVHAFPEGKKGSISISFRKCGEGAVLAVADDGVGLPAGFDLERQKSLGCQLVRMLSLQAGGRPEVETGPGGTRISIRLAPAPGAGSSANSSAGGEDRTA